MDIIAIIISVISAVIALVSTITSIYFNCKNQKQYNSSLEPALSFKLIEYNYMLYLQIINTGRSAAHNIKIDVKKIDNNGSCKLDLDDIFDSRFELFPDEATQGRIAFWGENVVEHTFPKVTIEVKYEEHITKKEIVYERNVIFSPAYIEKVYADVNMDLKHIEDSVKTIARASMRTANYLDGYQVSIVDEINILAGRSLHDDIMNAERKNKESNVIDRATLLQNLEKSR